MQNRIDDDGQNLLGQPPRTNYAGGDADAAKSKKKKIIIGVVSGIVVIGIILAIVIPLSLKSNDDNNTNPPDPFHFQEYNPYKVDENKVVK